MISEVFLSKDYTNGFEIGDVLFRENYSDFYARWEVTDKQNNDEYEWYYLKELTRENSRSINILVSLDEESCGEFFKNHEDLTEAILLTSLFRMDKHELIKTVEIKDKKYISALPKFMDMFPERFI